MLIDRAIRCDDDNVNAYITALEAELLLLDKSDIRRLILSVDRMSGKIADYFDAIADGKSKAEIEKAMPMSEKQIEVLIKIVDKVPKFKEVHDVLKSMQPEEKNPVKSAEQIKQDDATIPKVEKLKRINRIGVKH